MRDLAADSMGAGGSAHHRRRWIAQLLACLVPLAMIPLRGSKVRFYERYRPPQVRRGAVGVIVDMEERPTSLGPESWVRARFGDFITPWIEAWQLEWLS
jgi:hypothetical protein